MCLSALVQVDLINKIGIDMNYGISEREINRCLTKTGRAALHYSQVHGQKIYLQALKDGAMRILKRLQDKRGSLDMVSDERESLDMVSDERDDTVKLDKHIAALNNHIDMIIQALEDRLSPPETNRREPQTQQSGCEPGLSREKGSITSLWSVASGGDNFLPLWGKVPDNWEEYADRLGDADIPLAP